MERSALVDTLRGIRDEQWATPSLCEGWTVRDVLGHLSALGHYYGKFFITWWIGVALAGFRANRFLFRDARRRAAAAEPASLIDSSEQTRGLRPHLDPRVALTEMVVHGADIRKPLGVGYAPEEFHLSTVLDFLVQKIAYPYWRSWRWLGESRRFRSWKEPGAISSSACCEDGDSVTNPGLAITRCAGNSRLEPTVALRAPAAQPQGR